jgi:hypothetical protein
MSTPCTQAAAAAAALSLAVSPAGRDFIGSSNSSNDLNFCQLIIRSSGRSQIQQLPSHPDDTHQ